MLTFDCLLRIRCSNARVEVPAFNSNWMLHDSFSIYLSHVAVGWQWWIGFDLIRLENWRQVEPSLFHHICSTMAYNRFCEWAMRQRLNGITRLLRPIEALSLPQFITPVVRLGLWRLLAVHYWWHHACMCSLHHNHTNGSWQSINLNGENQNVVSC